MRSTSPGLLASFFICLALVALPLPGLAQSDQLPVFKAVLLYSPNCPHCLDVMQKVLYPVADQYGKQFMLLGIDVTGKRGREIYWTVIDQYRISDERRGVPMLIAGEVCMVGGQEIAEQLPALIHSGLTAGGLNWPDISGLEPVILEVYAEEPGISDTISTAPLPVQSLARDESLLDSARRDPIGFALATAVLLSMVATFGYHLLQLILAWKTGPGIALNPTHAAQTWGIPFFSLVGLGIAVYLAYIEITQRAPICGPVDECNLVQSSVYAHILGVPVAVLGVLFYAGMCILWAGQKVRSQKPGRVAVFGLVGLTMLGVLFSIYLTLMELFVIRAICLWCLSSALISTLVMLFAMPAASRRHRIGPAN